MESSKSGNRKFIFRVTVFLFALIFTLYELSLLFMPKSFFDVAYPSASSVLGFYKLPKDSVDVLFLGSSHAIAGFDTQELYDNYGIRGYTLGSGEQNVLVSYYYLMEALKTQKPKAVVLDTLMLFPFRKNKLLYSSTASSESAFNYIKPGINKIKAIMEMDKYDDELTACDLLLPFFRYHERWDELDRYDLMIWDKYSTFGLHGYKLKYGNIAGEDHEYAPFDKNDSNEKTVIAEHVMGYLDRIRETCERNGIKLFLVKTPSNKTGIEEYNALQEYSDKYGIRYIDFNEKEIYNRMGFDFSTDMKDIGHANYLGALKITDMIGEELLADGIPSNGKDSEWEKTEEIYNYCKENFLLSVAEEDDDIMALADRDRYCVFMVSDENGEDTAYVKTGDNRILYKDGTAITGVLPDSTAEYCVQKDGKKRSIIIDGEEYAEEDMVRTMVVYDSVLRDIIDIICIDDSGEIIHD